MSREYKVSVSVSNDKDILEYSSSWHIPESPAGWSSDLHTYRYFLQPPTDLQVKYKLHIITLQQQEAASERKREITF